jgi:AcrR family transcriptional regulator
LNTADLILHPIRLRILQTFIGDRRLSARQVCALLPDVSQATLYRHFQKLTQAKILVVIEERPIRGTVEKFYILQEQRAEIAPAELATLSRDDHQRYFATFMAILLSDFEHYLQQDDIDLERDGVGYRQIALYLSKTELTQLTKSINQALKPFLEQKPSKRRKRMLLSSIFIPGE